MVIRKKKKKKEEFDASLMGEYLPGARVPVSATPVDALSKVYNLPPGWQSSLGWSWEYIPRGPSDPGPEDEVVPLSRQFLMAWAFYGLGGIADPKNLLEARGWSRLLGVGYGMGWVASALVGFFAFGLVATAIDPLHKWEGGLDETKAYQEIVHKIKTDEAPSNLIWQHWGGLGTVV